jgi:di-N-acetylchitobiase
LKKINAGYQTSVCAAWTPGTPWGVDNRAYDYKALADASDFLYVMQYDTRSQIYD